MYSLIVTGSEDAWTKRTNYSFAKSRFGEYTEQSIKEHFTPLDEKLINELISLPVLFAYEKGLNLPARVGRITRITAGSDGDIAFDFMIENDFPPIQLDKLIENACDFGIADWELNRTHWSVKNLNLFKALRQTGLLSSQITSKIVEASTGISAADQLIITPLVFSAPSEDPDPTLVSVMMPFSSDFDRVYSTIKCACHRVGLQCVRADDIWVESTIIQDIFNLIYRSSVVIVDLTGRNSNVLYETGIAHTLGRQVIPITRNGENIPFDIAHHRILTYLPNDQGLAEMKVKLEKRLLQVSINP